MNDTKKCGNCRDEIADCMCYMRMVRDRDAEIAILTAEVARLTIERDEYLERMEKWHNECLHQIRCNCELRTLMRASSEHSAGCVGTASSSVDAKTTAEGSGANTPSCEKEPSPASACETESSERPTHEPGGHTTTRPGVSDGATVFVVMAHRGGDVENHTYCAAVCSSLSAAKTSADDHEQYRGGKYACSILEVMVWPFREDATDFVEVRKVTPIPGWKTALERVLDDRERDKRAETAERERDEARKEIEALVWNLAGCGTIAESGRPQKFNRDMARPALVSVSDMAAKLQTAERELEALRAAVRYLDDRGAIDVQDETVWVRDGDDMQPAPPEHAEALRKATT